MKKICLIALIAFASCNSNPKVEAVKEIPLEEQQAKLDDTLMKMTAKMMEDSTVLKDSAFKKTFYELSNRRDTLKMKIEAQQNDSTKK